MKWLLLFGLLFQSSLGYDFDAFVKDMDNYDTSDVYQVLDLLHSHEIVNKDEVNFDLSEFDTADTDEDLDFTDEAISPIALQCRAAVLALRSKILTFNAQVSRDLLTLATKLLSIRVTAPAPAPAPPLSAGRYQYFRIVNGYSYLTLCAVQLYGQLNGVGLTRRIPLSTAAARQINTGWGGVAGRAVDNVDDPNWGGGHCSHTASQRGSWWQVKLPGYWTLRTVRILNRKDCCADRLRALTFYGSVDGRSFRKIGFYPGPAGAGAWVLVRLGTTAPPPPPPPQQGLFSYFRIVNGYSYLTLCAVYLYGQLNGVGGTVRINIPQSYATQINTGWGGVPGRAIDGVSDPNWSGGHCSHTLTQRGSWWQVRLPGRYRLRFVRILNRKDCCADRLRTLTFQGSLDGRSFVNIGSYPGPAGAGAWVTVPFRVIVPPPVAKYRYFRIVNGYSYLTLCAVQLYGQYNGVGTVRRIPTNPAWTRQINTGWGGVPGRAVDGVDDPNWGGGHCSHTASQRGSWWQTMLPGYWSVRQVRILNRKDCCADRLRALTFYGSMGINGPFQRLGFYAGPAGAGAWVIVNLAAPSPPTPKYQSFRIVNGFSYLTLCGVELYGKAGGNGAEVKLALTPPLATQINTGWGGVAGRAVDGNNNGNYFSGHCSHTVTQRGSWWQVRLPPVAGGWELTRVKIWNRADCCWDRLRSLSFYGGSSPTGGAFKRIGVYGGPAGRGAVVEVRLNSRGLLEALEALDEEDYDFTDEDINYDFEQEAIVEEHEYNDDDTAEADIEDDEQYDNYQNALLIVNSNQNYLVQLFHQYPLFSIFAIFVLSFTFIYYFINRKPEKKLFSSNSSEYTPLKTNP